MGGYHPPATHYHLGGEEDGGFYAEFLSPLTGSDYDRRQKRKVTTGVGGIVAQQLRYIELLLHAPWSVDFDTGELAVEIQIANPAAFLAQKVLIHAKRSREDRAKDLLYIHDTLEVFGEQLPELQRLWRELVSRQLHPRSAKAVSRASGNLFGQLTDDIRRAAEISRERALAPEAIRQLCRYGCSAVFG